MKFLVVALVMSVLQHGSFAGPDYNAAYKAYSNNKYWTLLSSGTNQNAVAAQRSTKNEDTTFTRMDLSTGKTKLWSPSAQAYLCRVSRGASDYLEAVSGRDDATCQFTVTDSGTGWARFKADNSKYLCVVQEGSTAFIKIKGTTACDHFQEVLRQF